MCIKRLKKYKNIEVIQDNSSVVLASVIREINKKAIFWMDGHYLGGFLLNQKKKVL